MDVQSEKSIASVYTVVYDFSVEKKTWKVAGDGGWSELHICEDKGDQSYRILAWTHETQEVLVNVNLDAKCEYKEKSENFHSFKDSEGSRRGFGFHRSDRNLVNAEEFKNKVLHTLKKLKAEAHVHGNRAPSVIGNQIPKLPAEERFNPPEMDEDGKMRIRPTRTEDLKKRAQDEKISDVTNVQRKAHVSLNEDGTYKIVNPENLPEGWKQLANQKFGINPSKIPGIELQEYKSKIPLLLVQLKQRLCDLQGLQEVGIFRLAPDAGESNKVKKMINEGEDWLNYKCDVNVISNLIKIWFRDLPRPILNAVDPAVIEMSQTVEGLEKAMGQFPEPDRSLLEWLWDFCCEISDFSQVNKMSVQNLGIVIGPNLFNTLNFENPMKAMDFSGKVVTFFQKGVEMRNKMRGEVKS